MWLQGESPARETALPTHFVYDDSDEITYEPSFNVTSTENTRLQERHRSEVLGTQPVLIGWTCKGNILMLYAFLLSLATLAPNHLLLTVFL